MGLLGLSLPSKDSCFGPKDPIGFWAILMLSVRSIGFRRGEGGV